MDDYQVQERGAHESEGKVLTRPVAETLPWMPPWVMGLPVTHAWWSMFPCPASRWEKPH